MAEICNECGRSVKPGSGDFVNRVPDLNTPEERKEMGKQFPEGDFVCAECDSNADKEEYLELHCAIDHDHVDMSLSTAFFRQRRIREIEKEYNADITNKWLEELNKECDHEWVSDGEVRIDCLGECLKKPVKCEVCGLLGDEVWMFSCYVDRNTGGMI